MCYSSAFSFARLYVIWQPTEQTKIKRENKCYHDYTRNLEIIAYKISINWPFGQYYIEYFKQSKNNKNEFGRTYPFSSRDAKLSINSPINWQTFFERIFFK